MRPYVQILWSDVGKDSFLAFGRYHPVSGFIGRILAEDVGRRVYLDTASDMLQIETLAQFSARRELAVHSH